MLFTIDINYRTSSSRNGESPRDDEVVIVVPTDREDTPPRLVTDSSGDYPFITRIVDIDHHIITLSRNV